MVDSKENYKFDLAVKGLNSDGDDWSSLHSPPSPKIMWSLESSDPP